MKGLSKREAQSVRELVERGGSPSIEAAVARVKARRPKTLHVTIEDGNESNGLHSPIGYLNISIEATQ